MTDAIIEIQDEAVMEAFNRLLAITDDTSPVLDALGRQFKTNVQLEFARGVDPYGQPWAPLKVRKGQPLVDSGHLRDSFDYQVEGNSLVIGTNMEYAPTHQFGATITPKNAKALRFYVGGQPVFVGSVTIPARPFLPVDNLPDEWRDDSLAILRDVITGAF